MNPEPLAPVQQKVIGAAARTSKATGLPIATHCGKGDQAAEILDTDADLRARMRDVRARIAPNQIGQYGQLQEWLEDVDDPANKHRHVSHLWGVHPGVEITPYGTETMHVLRAEKGYIIVGQDTDGTVTPHDAGLSWAVGKKKSDFVGIRGLTMPFLGVWLYKYATWGEHAGWGANLLWVAAAVQMVAVVGFLMLPEPRPGE